MGPFLWGGVSVCEGQWGVEVSMGGGLSGVISLLGGYRIWGGSRCGGPLWGGGVWRGLSVGEGLNLGGSIWGDHSGVLYGGSLNVGGGLSGGGSV